MVVEDFPGGLSILGGEDFVTNSLDQAFDLAAKEIRILGNQDRAGISGWA